MKKKFTKKQKVKIIEQWELIEKAQQEYYKVINDVEATLQKQLELKVEVVIIDGEIIGVGTYDKIYDLLFMPEAKYFDELYLKEEI